MEKYGVVIPAYNGAETIEEAIQSVLEQTLPPSQVVVVDDGSADNTTTVASEISDLVTVISQENRGGGYASSVGARAIKTPLLAFLDHDDLWLPEKMHEQVSLLNDRPDVDLVYSSMRQFRHGSSDRTSGEVRLGPVRSTITMRHKAFLSVGDIIDPSGGVGDIVDWMARFREAGYVEHNLSSVLALRRIISTSMTYNLDSAGSSGYLEVARQAILRRRQRQNASDDE